MAISRSNVPPRLYVMVATRAPVAVVFRRGPAPLVATLDGRLEIRAPDHPRYAAVSSHSLAALRPAPRQAPEWARRW